MKFTIHGLTLRGVAGHAGLFSTADDLTRYGQQMLRLAMGNERLPFGQATFYDDCPRNVERDSKVIGTRTYGWDHRSPFSMVISSLILRLVMEDSPDCHVD